MLELSALKEQLRLLGHGDLEDTVVLDILKGMNIAVDTSDQQPGPPPPAATSAQYPAGPAQQVHPAAGTVSSSWLNDSISAASAYDAPLASYGAPHGGPTTMHPAAAAQPTMHRGAHELGVPSGAAAYASSAAASAAAAANAAASAAAAVAAAPYGYTSSYTRSAPTAAAHLRSGLAAVEEEDEVRLSVGGDINLGRGGAGQRMGQPADVAAPEGRQPHEWYGKLHSDSRADAPAQVNRVAWLDTANDGGDDSRWTTTSARGGASHTAALGQTQHQGARSAGGQWSDTFRQAAAAAATGRRPAGSSRNSHALFESDSEEDDEARPEAAGRYSRSRPQAQAQSGHQHGASAGARQGSGLGVGTGAGVRGAAAAGGAQSLLGQLSHLKVAAGLGASDDEGEDDEAGGLHGGDDLRALHDAYSKARQQHLMQYSRAGSGGGPKAYAGAGDGYSDLEDDDKDDVRAPANERVYGGRRVSAAGLSVGGRDVARAPRPAKYHWHEHLRSSSPTSTSGGLSRQPSLASMPTRSVSAVPGGGRGGATVKKIDRVARYKQLEQSWSKDKFLKKNNGGPTGSRQAPGTSVLAPRAKPVNFHNHFAALHAAEAEQRHRTLQQTRAKTAQALKPGQDYVAPTSKRRDALRWETRMRMQE